MIPFSFIKTNWDADALAYISNFTDMPINCKLAINNLVKYHKANGIWTPLKYAIICPVTMSETEVLRELKNNVIRASGITYAAENVATNFPAGYNFQIGSTNFLDVGRTFTQIGVATTSSCIIHGEKRNYTGATAYAYGIIQSATQRALLIPKNSADAIAGQMFSQTNGVATAAGANTDARGIYALNRTANNYIELVKDGTVRDTDAAIVAATLPTANPYIGNAQGVSSYKSGIIDFWAVYTGLTNAERLLAEQGWANYRTDMGRSGNYTKSIIMDGNSLAVRGAHRTFRKAIYGLGMNNYNTYNIAVASQNIDDMITRYPTYAAPLYDSSLTKNIYIAFEIGNQLVNTAIADVKQKMIDLLGLAAATGFTTICMAPDARDNTGAKSDTQFNLEMDEIVQWVRAGSSGADYYIDVTSPNMWADRSAYGSDALYNTAIAAIVSNATYYTDGVHKTQAGYDLRGVDMTTTLLIALQ